MATALAQSICCETQSLDSKAVAMQGVGVDNGECCRTNQQICWFYSAMQHAKHHLEALYDIRAWSETRCHFLQFLVIIAVLSLLANLQLVQGGDPNVDVAMLKEGAAVAEEEGEKKGADVRTIHICICQQNDLQASQPLS